MGEAGSLAVFEAEIGVAGLPRSKGEHVGQLPERDPGVIILEDVRRKLGLVEDRADVGAIARQHLAQPGERKCPDTMLTDDFVG
jgi:hypothetical protein